MRRWLLALALLSPGCAKFYAEDAPPSDAGVDATSEASVDAGTNDGAVPIDGSIEDANLDGSFRGPSLCANGEASLFFEPTMETSGGAGFTAIPAGMSLVSVVSDDAPDDAASAVRTGAGIGTLRFAHKTVLLPVGAKITRVSVRARARGSGATATDGGLSVGLYFKKRNDMHGNAFAPLGPTYTVQDHSLLNEPFAARPWEVSDMSDLEMLVRLDAQGNQELHLTRVWMEICLASQMP